MSQASYRRFSNVSEKIMRFGRGSLTLHEILKTGDLRQPKRQEGKDGEKALYSLPGNKNNVNVRLHNRPLRAF